MIRMTNPRGLDLNQNLSFPGICHLDFFQREPTMTICYRRNSVHAFNFSKLNQTRPRKRGPNSARSDLSLQRSVCTHHEFLDYHSDCLMDECRSSTVLQQPLVKLRIIIGLRPRVMIGLGVNRQLDVRDSIALEGFHHALAFRKWNDCVLSSMKRPNA